MEILQHAVVTLVALAAAAVVLRRLFGFLSPRAEEPRCAGCPSTQGACAPTAPQPGGGVVHPAVLVRRAAVPVSGLSRR